MGTVVLPGPTVGKKKNSKPPETPSGEVKLDRVEFQAEADWITELDKAARAQGLSRSAYIRLACNRQMRADRREVGGE